MSIIVFALPGAGVMNIHIRLYTAITVGCVIGAFAAAFEIIIRTEG